MAEELKEFEAKLAAERRALESEQAARREAFIKAIESKRKAEEEEELRRKKEAEAHSVASEKTATATATVAVATSPAPATPQSPAPAGCPGKSAGNCSGCGMKDQCAGQKKENAEMMNAVNSRMSAIKHKVLVLSGKGGVGKSMVSSQLAFALARRGYSVGLLDIDICGPTVPKMLGLRGQGVMKGENGLEPVRLTPTLCAMSIGFIADDENTAVIWRGPRKLGLIQMFLRDIAWGDLDYLIVDTPPGTSDEHISIVQLLSQAGIDGAIVVTSPQDVSVIEVGKEINFCRRMNVPVLGVVENFASFSCPMCAATTDIWPATSGGGAKLAMDHECPFLGRVPLDPRLARAGEAGVSYTVSDTATSHALESIADQVVMALEP